MPTMEQIIQPFQGEDVGPVPYVQPGQEGVAPAPVQIGLIGGTQTFTGDLTYQQSTKLGAVHTEGPSNSQVIQDVIANPSGNN